MDSLLIDFISNVSSADENGAACVVALQLCACVEPVGFHRTADGAIIAEVRQTVRDLEGKPLQGQTHGLKDKMVGHVFRLRKGKVARFDIQDAA